MLKRALKAEYKNKYILMIVGLFVALAIPSVSANWNTNYPKCKNLALTNISAPLLLDKAQPVTVNITGLTFTNATKEIRIMNASCGNTTGTELEFDIIEDSGNIGDGNEWVRLLFPYTFNNTVAVLYDYASASENTSLRLEDDDIWNAYYNGTVLPNLATKAWTAEECGDSTGTITTIDGQLRYNLTTGATYCSWKNTGLTIAQATGYSYEASFKIPSTIVPTQATKAQGYLIMVDGTSESQSSYNRTHVWRGSTYLSIPNTDNYHTIRFTSIGSANANVWIDGIYKGVIAGGAYAQKYFAWLTYDDYQMIYWDYVTYSNNSGSYLYPQIAIGTEQSAGTSPQWSNNLTTPTSPVMYGPNAEYKFNVTCTDTTGMWNAWLILNATTYNMGNTTSKYNYTLRDLKAGEYTYTFTCNNTVGITNITSALRYIVEKNNRTAFHLAINGTENNQTLTYPSVSNVTAWNNVTNSNGITLLKDNSSASNPDIVRLAYGYYNYTAVYLQENYTTSNTTITYYLTIDQANSGLILTSSAGWSLFAGDSTNVVCTANSPLTLTLKINDMIVSTPYSLVTQSGTYTATCTISDVYNYTPSTASNTLVVNPLISCTSPSIFGFNKTITTDASWSTLNFTDLVGLHYVRSNLGDVSISNVTGVYVNKTNGYYIVVNNTGVSTFTVKFGNYYANNTYTNYRSNTTYVHNLTSYNQVYYTVLYNVLDELTGEELFPPNTTLTSIVHCSMGENYIPIDNNEVSFLLATQYVIDKASLRVTYTADVYYSRQLYPATSDFIIVNFYTIDAYENALDRIDFLMNDFNYYDQKLQIYKPYNNSNMIITEGYFDASHYFSAFLMEDSDYYIRTIEVITNTTTSFGRITVVKPDTKTLGNVYLNLNPQAVLISKNILMNAYMSSDRNTLYVSYEDKLDQTNSVNILVYLQNGTIYKNETYTTPIVATNYNTTGMNTTSFTVLFTVSHASLGNSPIRHPISLAYAVAWGIGSTAVYMYNLFALTGLTLIGGITTRKSLIAGSMIYVIGFFVFWGLGWLGGIPVEILGVFVVFMFSLSIINYLKTGGE